MGGESKYSGTNSHYETRFTIFHGIYQHKIIESQSNTKYEKKGIQVGEELKEMKTFLHKKESNEILGKKTKPKEQRQKNNLSVIVQEKKMPKRINLEKKQEKTKRKIKKKPINVFKDRIIKHNFKLSSKKEVQQKTKKSKVKTKVKKKRSKVKKKGSNGKRKSFTKNQKLKNKKQKNKKQKTKKKKKKGKKKKKKKKKK